MSESTIPCRRLTWRIEAPEDVYVLWWCDGREVVSRVLNISMGGISIESLRPKSAGTITKVHFLVPEGPIRVDAVVAHTKQDGGAGLKFMAMKDDDRSKLGALMARLLDAGRRCGKNHNPNAQEARTAIARSDGLPAELT